MKPPRPHRATTANLQAVYPFVVGRTLPCGGPLVGTDILGGPFFFDPWDLYRSGVITSPNMIVVGQLGRGKSTLVKTLVWRQVAFGRQAWIVDPKGEYGPLARACASTPLRLAPGGRLRLNPLQNPGGGPPDTRRQSELASSLLRASLGRPLGPHERAAVEIAVTSVANSRPEPTLPALVGELLDPDPRGAASVGTDSAGLASDGRLVAMELRRLVDGDLRGMFDGPTSPGLDLSGRLVVVDLSAVFASAALPLIMTCASAWLQAAIGDATGTKRLVVVDEAWAVLSDLSTARWLQATFKLSRAIGVANVAVVHRLSDLKAAGDEGSAQQRLAEGLLADSETRVIFGQPASEVRATASLLGLSDTERDLIMRLPRGVALWKVGDSSFVVEHALGAGEVALVDTDSAMREKSDGFPGIPTDSAGTRE